MKEELLKQQVIHADETVVQVLKEPGKKAKTDSRMWVYSSGEIGSPSLLLFEYQPGRNGDYAKAFLEGYSGYLVCDGYGGYNKVKEVTRCGCWAHVRRKFVEALPPNPQEAETSQAAKDLEKCNALFHLEKKLAEVSSEDRQKKQQELATPMLDEFFARNKTSPSSRLCFRAKTVFDRLSDEPSCPHQQQPGRECYPPLCGGKETMAV